MNLPFDDCSKDDLSVLECALITYQGDLDVQRSLKVPGAEHAQHRTEILLAQVKAAKTRREM